ncbi:hypothetical protein KI688_007511 [Linnemannia hyalina]|uniref:Uncharacterized protein n=1 Tax=Linnemannia hyalina TaxID=64524 RepID=A0A9P7XIL9_9FUNG|nr:hypothetical protein KI688_007511 [Linnemannia hyalina]
MNPNATIINNNNGTDANPSTGAGQAGTGPHTPTATARPATAPTPATPTAAASPIRQLQLVLSPASAFGESILKSEYERLSKVISHLVSARFAAIDTLTLPTFNSASQVAPRPPAGHYEALVIWAQYRNDIGGFEDALTMKIQILEDQRSILVNRIFVAYDA